MKKRFGYNIIELLVVITAISLITAIAYKGFNILFNNIKTEGVRTEIKKVKTALAKSQAVGSIYWGGDYITDPSINGAILALTPKQNATIDTTGGTSTCNYAEIKDGTLVKRCDYDNIIYAENELFKQMEKMEFRYVAGTFRSSQFPTSKIGFLPNINGYSGIIFTDIPGIIAKKLYEEINSPKWEPTKDGLSSKRPLLIFPGGLVNFNTDTAADNMPIISTPPTSSDTGFQTFMDKKYTKSTLPPGQTNVLDYIGTQPKTTIIYMYTYRNTNWN